MVENVVLMALGGGLDQALAAVVLRGNTSDRVGFLLL